MLSPLLCVRYIYKVTFFFQLYPKNCCDTLRVFFCWAIFVFLSNQFGLLFFDKAKTKETIKNNTENSFSFFITRFFCFFFFQPINWSFQLQQVQRNFISFSCDFFCCRLFKKQSSVFFVFACLNSYQPEMNLMKLF